MPRASKSSLSFESRACEGAEELRSLLSRWAPASNLFDAAPTSARAILPGTRSFAFRIVAGGEAQAVAAGLVRPGRRQGGLLLLASSQLGMPPALLEGILGFARSHHLGNLVLDWMGDVADLPPLRGQKRCRTGETYLLDLASADPDNPVARNHRRNLKRSRRAGVVPVRLPEDEAVSAHIALCRSSLGRRADRGETIEVGLQAEGVRALTASGHGGLYQMAVEGRPVASDLVVRIGDAAWYLSGGTSREGMETGASHLLMSEIIRDLRASGCRRLNLGLTETEALARFKAGFGAEPISMARVDVTWTSPLGRAFRRAARLLRG